MSTQTTCPGCRHSYEVPAHFLGKVVRCPQCRTEFKSPARPESSDDDSPLGAPGGYADRAEPAQRPSLPPPPRRSSAADQADGRAPARQREWDELSARK